MKGKTLITLLGIAAIGLGGAHAHAQLDAKLSQLDRDELRELRELGDRESFKSRLQELGVKRSNRPQLSEDQKDIIKNLRELGDREAIKEQFEEWGIEKINKGLRKARVFENLTENQKNELQKLRESGTDREVIREKLEEFGVELPEKRSLTEDQKNIIKNLRESEDREALHEYFEELGLKKHRKYIHKRTQVFESLSNDEKEILQEARDIARAGDKETAREMVKEILEDTSAPKGATKGFFGFFKKIFNN